VEIRIGIANTGRELNFETSQAAADVQKAVAGALDAGATHVTFSDAKGTSYIVPTASLAYVELGTEESRRVGFVA
jgi:pyruvate/2-oxoacid:ferredoxin oxidoreductase alpha subunit